MREIINLKPFEKICRTIGNLPSSYKESMSYEQQLLWFCDFLQNTVIPVVNENGESVTELQELYVILKDYVDNYFNNLDIQKEINNKLDKMVEDGALIELLEDLFNISHKKITAYNPEFFGAVGDGVKDDTIALQKTINFCQEYGFAITSNKNKIYRITAELNLDDKIMIDLQLATIKVDNNINNAIKLRTKNANMNNYFKNIIIEGNNLCQIGLNVDYFPHSNIDNIYINNCNTGMLAHNSHETTYTNIHIDNCNIGLLSETSDANFTDIFFRECKTGMKITSGYCFYTNIHGWLSKNFENSIFCEVSVSNSFTNCFPDTYQIGYKITKFVTITINGGFYYINEEYWNNEKADLQPYFLYYNDIKHSGATLISNFYLLGKNNEPFIKFSNFVNENFAGILNNNKFLRCENVPFGINSKITLGPDFNEHTNLIIKNGNNIELNLYLISKMDMTNGKKHIGTVPTDFRPANDVRFICGIGISDSSITNPIMCYISSETGNIYIYNNITINGDYKNHVFIHETYTSLTKTT